MQTLVKRPLALLLAAALVLSSLCVIPLTASAQEQSASDGYVLRYEGEGAQPYLYGSRYEFKHSYNDPEAGESSVWTYWNCPEIFNLVNTADGSSIAAYCTDADTSTVGNTAYRRINLEDSTYHATGAASRLRAILLNTFPRKTVAEVQAAAEKAGYAVQELAQGELISATQQAIWKITHGDKYTVDDHSTGLRSMSSYDESEFVYPESLKASLTDYTASNMENLYQYFLSLEGTDPITDAVSEYTFEDLLYTAEAVQDGGYTIRVTFDAATSVDSGDALTLTATCGSVVKNQSLTAGANTVTFTGIPSQAPVLLEISGYEQGGDVYLFDAQGNRTASQSMIGYDDSRLPVYAQAIAGPDRTLRLYKTTGDESKTPLENIQFSVYHVGSLTDYLAGALNIGETPSDADLAKYATEANLVDTITTDADGMASLNLGQTDGVYLVVELENDLIQAPVSPFFVALPMKDADTGVWTFTVEVSPKNTVIDQEVDIGKDVTQIGNDHDSFAVGQSHTWIIRSSIPTGMASGTRYVITDTLDSRLTYNGNLLVTVAKADDAAKTETLQLTPTTDYTLETGTATDAAGNTVDTFAVSLTSAGMEKVAAAAASDPENTYEVRVYFDALINQQADLGTEIPNQATLDYTNHVGVDYQDVSDVPEVHTGGLNVLKLDAGDGTPLAGASFRLTRAAIPGETPDLTVTLQGVETGLVYVDFYPTTDLSGSKVTEVTTGENGLAVLYGLAYGEYYLIETAAPQGYHPLEKPVAVEVTATSHALTDADGSYVVIRNSAEFILPNAGGVGTLLFTAGGMTLIALAAALFLISRKKKYSA